MEAKGVMKRAGIGILAAILLLCGCNQNAAQKGGDVADSTAETAVQTTEEAVNVFVVYCEDSLTAELCRQFKQAHGEIPMRIIENADKQMAAWERGMNPDNEAYPDLVAVSSGELQRLAQAGLLQPLSDVGIKEADTAQMYEFMKEMGMEEDCLYGLTWQQTAVQFLYNRNLAQNFLDVENVEGMQDAVGEWTSLYTAADTVVHNSDGKARLLDSLAEVEHAILSTTPAWYEDGVMHIPDVLMDYMELYPELQKNELTWGEQPSGEQAARLRDKYVLGCFADAYLIRQELQDMGVRNGEWGLCYGPQTYAEEAVMLAVPTECSDPALAKQLLQDLTCNAEQLEEFALDKLVPVNHKEVMERLAETDEGKDPFLKNQNVFKEYTNAANQMPSEAPSQQDVELKELFLSEISAYFSGKRDIEETLAHFEKAVQSL